MNTGLMYRIRHFLFSLVLAGAPLSAKDVGIDMLIFSTGSWVTFKDPVGTAGKDSYFNSLKPDVYFHIYGIKGYIGAPLTLTLESFDDSLRYAFYPADLTITLGKQFGPVEPRFGLDVPLGYPTGNNAWIGSNNVSLVWGLGFHLGRYIKDRLSLGGEAMGRVFLTGLQQNARFGRGSYKAYVAVKASYAFTRKWNAGLEIFPYLSYFNETDWTVNDADPSFSSAGFLPYLFAGYQPSPKMEIAGKVAVGREYAGPAGNKAFTSVMNTILNVNFYLW